MTKGDIFVFANNFVVLFFSSLEEEVTCLTDVKKETEREKKWETLFLGVKRVNNRAYWRLSQATRRGTPTTTTGSSTITERTGSRPAGQNVFVKEFHSSKRRTSLARTRVLSTPAIVNRDLCPFGDTRPFILRAYTSSFAFLARFKWSAEELSIWNRFQR